MRIGSRPSSVHSQLPDETPHEEHYDHVILTGNSIGQRTGQVLT